MSLPLSVVITSFNGADRLGACLAALEPELDPAVEVLVVGDWHGRPRSATLERRWPFVRWIDAPAGTTVPHLRSLGAREARYDTVAMLEDDCLVERGWCAAVRDTQNGAPWAVGGAVEPGALPHLRAWAVYFLEYGRFMRPLSREGPIAGNHVAYNRPALLDALNGDGLYDVFLHDRWRREGRDVRADGRLVVRIEHDWPSDYLWRVPFHHGRAYAAQRFATRSWPFRAAFAAATPLLPALQVARIVKLVVSRRRFAGRLALALPAVLLFAASWAVGEMTGAVFGPGRSAGEWR